MWEGETKRMGREEVEKKEKKGKKDKKYGSHHPKSDSDQEFSLLGFLLVLRILIWFILTHQTVIRIKLLFKNLIIEK